MDEKGTLGLTQVFEIRSSGFVDRQGPCFGESPANSSAVMLIPWFWSVGLCGSTKHFNHTHTCWKNRDQSLCLVVTASLDLFTQGINVKYTFSTCELCKSIARFVNIKIWCLYWHSIMQSTHLYCACLNITNNTYRSFGLILTADKTNWEVSIYSYV